MNEAPKSNIRPIRHAGTPVDPKRMKSECEPLPPEEELFEDDVQSRKGFDDDGEGWPILLADGSG